MQVLEVPKEHRSDTHRYACDTGSPSGPKSCEGKHFSTRDDAQCSTVLPASASDLAVTATFAGPLGARRHSVFVFSDVSSL